VRITQKKGGQITVTPFDPQPEPPNLIALKSEITARWPMTSLLDMVKEADLRLNFTDTLKSPTAYESLERSILRPRLLLCLHGIGTNAGLQRMAGLQSGVTQKDLLGVDIATVEKILNHSGGSFAGIVGVYQRHDFANEKRKALDLWAAHIETLIAENVFYLEAAE
jgi:hypothetical protein